MMMPMRSLEDSYCIYRDRFGQPTASTPSVPIPSFIIHQDHPLPWLPFYPQYPTRPPYPSLPILVPVAPAPSLPSSPPPPSPTPYPLPPSPPVFPPSPPKLPPEPQPPSDGTACSEYDANCTASHAGEYDWGDCTLTCIMCCTEKCGPAAYSRCAAGCPEEPGDCSVTVIDPPEIPEDEWDWLETICELLKAWGVLPDDVNCKLIQWIQFL